MELEYTVWDPTKNITLLVSTPVERGAQAETATRLAERFPDAVAEAMEGYGVAEAANGRPFVELRAISNAIGPRDRSAWRLKEAFQALSTASAALWTACG